MDFISRRPFSSLLLRTSSIMWEIVSLDGLATVEKTRFKTGVCWWEEPLVVALKHSEGIKHTVLFQEQKLTNTKNLIHALSLSL